MATLDQAVVTIPLQTPTTELTELACTVNDAGGTTFYQRTARYRSHPHSRLERLDMGVRRLPPDSWRRRRGSERQPTRLRQRARRTLPVCHPLHPARLRQRSELLDRLSWDVTATPAYLVALADHTMKLRQILFASVLAANTLRRGTVRGAPGATPGLATPGIPTALAPASAPSQSPSPQPTMTGRRACRCPPRATAPRGRSPAFASAWAWPTAACSASTVPRVLSSSGQPFAWASASTSAGR